MHPHRGDRRVTPTHRGHTRVTHAGHPMPQGDPLPVAAHTLPPVPPAPSSPWHPPCAPPQPSLCPHPGQEPLAVGPAQQEAEGNFQVSMQPCHLCLLLQPWPVWGQGTRWVAWGQGWDGDRDGRRQGWGWDRDGDRKGWRQGQDEDGDGDKDRDGDGDRWNRGRMGTGWGPQEDRDRTRPGLGTGKGTGTSWDREWDRRGTGWGHDGDRIGRQQRPAQDTQAHNPAPTLGQNPGVLGKPSLGFLQGWGGKLRHGAGGGGVPHWH